MKPNSTAKTSPPRRSTAFLFASLIGLTLCAPSATAAQAFPLGNLSNFDVWNRTGVTANDFDLFLDGITPAQITSTWTGSYPNVTKTFNGTGTLLHWTGNFTAPGSSAHFGVHLLDNLSPTSTTWNWTFGGTSVGSVPGIWQPWFFLPGVVRDRLINPWTFPLWIQRRVIIAPRIIGLGDLLVGGQLWNDATVIDSSPILFPGGSSILDFDFPDQGTTASYAMMYDLYSDNNGVPGDQIATFLNATDVPEPQTGLLVSIGLAGLMLSWRRGRSALRGS